MGHVTFIAALTLLYLQWGTATPIPSGKEYVYSYKGIVQAKNSGSDLYASQWQIAAKLILQSNGKDIAMKFKDVKTSLFNGEVEHLDAAVEKPLPEDAHHLYQPFVVHYHTNGSASSISYQPDDPLWSLNIKRAIGSIIQIDFQHVTSLHDHKFFEQSIYGSCEAAYSVHEKDSVKTITKTIDDSSCVEDLYDSWSSSPQAPVLPEHFKPLSTVVVRKYRFAHKDHGDVLEHIESNANLTFQTMHCEPTSQQLVQSQVFELVSEAAISDPIDISKNTESGTLEYFFDENDLTSGRHKTKAINSTELMDNLEEYYKQFREDIRAYPLVPGDLGINSTLESIFTTLVEMDEDAIDLTALGVIFSGGEVQSIFVSMLPYIGSNETTELIKDILAADSFNDLVAIKIMGTFPKYVDKYTPELLKKMEVLMNLAEAEITQVKYAGILCFASLVAEANIRTEIPQKQLEKYYKDFTTHFDAAKDYEVKMIYLLGLINMGSLLDADDMISIITDKEQSHHIRTLAAYGFKPHLTSNPEKMFEKLWHEVLNHTEHYEVRVGVLDLLMSSDLTQHEFDTILNEFKKPIEDPYHEHLQNYLATTISSLSNETQYSDYLTAKIMASKDSVTIPHHDTKWTTGNYRLSYTDSMANFGGYLQARLIADPMSNTVSLMQLSYNNFAMSLNLGTYSAYIKVEGVDDVMFIQHYLNDRPNSDITIEDLWNLIHKFNFRMVEYGNVHIEVVLFCDDRVVFGIHLNKDIIDKFTDNPLFGDLLKLLVDYEFVTYPKMHMGNMRSDMGTHIGSRIFETDIISHKFEADMDKFFDDDTEVKEGAWHYRSSRHEHVFLESYNPFVNVRIGVNKFKSWAERVNLSLAVNVTGGYFTFDNTHDALNVAIGKSIDTNVDDEIVLKEYCPSCLTYFEFPIQQGKEKILSIADLGIDVNVTAAKGDSFADDFTYKLLDSYNGNAETMPFAEPLLMLHYAVDYYRYLGPEMGTFSFRTQPTYEEATENVLEWDFDVDDVYDENDPINGTDIHSNLKISCRRKHDAKVLSSTSLQYKYADGPVSSDKGHANHIEQRHKLRAYYNDATDKYSLCADAEFKYPSRRSDMWSISAVEAAKGKARFSVGAINDNEECSNDFSIIYSDIFEPSADYMEAVKEMDEYKQCKKDSEGFKYTPATLACGTVHEVVSKYSNYTAYLDLKNAGQLSKLDEMLRTSDRGFKLFEFNYLNDEDVHVKISKDFLNALPVDIEGKSMDEYAEYDTSLGIFSGMEDPTTIAYGSGDVDIGLSFVCDITPSTIYTFTDKIIEHYESKDGKEIVAYVECIHESRGGMTIQKYSDKKIGFTMWSGDDQLVTSFAGDKLKIALNGQELHSQYSNDHQFKVYFLEDDVIYITNQIVEVYYNTEYISIKAPAIYNKYVCGLCAHSNTHVTGTENEV